MKRPGKVNLYTEKMDVWLLGAARSEAKGYEVQLERDANVL